MKKSEVYELIKEEINNIKIQKRLDEALDKKDYVELKDIIRAEVAAIFWDLFKKKNIWI